MMVLMLIFTVDCMSITLSTPYDITTLSLNMMRELNSQILAAEVDNPDAFI